MSAEKTWLKLLVMAHHPMDLQRFEELTLNTSPALREAFIDGWVVRASASETRRANSATCLYRSAVPFADTCEAIVAWYQRHQQRPIFRMTSLATAAADVYLASQDYQHDTETLFMTASLDGVLPVIGPTAGTRLVARSIEEGLVDLHAVKGMVGLPAVGEFERQSLWRGEQRFLTLKNIDGSAAVGLARKEGSHVGIFNMHTAASERGKGYATRLLAELLGWGQSVGARHAFLQVEQANVGAVALYEKLGFRAQYSYWHRLQAK